MIKDIKFSEKDIKNFQFIYLLKFNKKIGIEEARHELAKLVKFAEFKFNRFNTEKI